MQRIERVHQCAERYHRALGFRWESTKRIAHRLPSGSSLIFLLNKTHCEHLKENAGPYVAKGSPVGQIAWVDDVDSPSLIEIYSLHSSSVSDEEASNPKVFTRSLVLTVDRSSGKKAYTVDDAKEIGWFGVPKLRSENRKRIFTEYSALVLTPSQWRDLPGAVRQLSRITTLSSVASLRADAYAKATRLRFSEGKPGAERLKFFPIRPRGGEFWFIDRQSSGIAALYPTDNPEVLSPAHIDGVQFSPSRDALFDPDRQELIVILKGSMTVQ